MEQRIEELKKRYRNANAAELEAIKIEMAQLAAEDNVAFETAMLNSIQNTTETLKKERLRKQLENILPAISVSYLSKNYFNKTPQWFYQRLNGNTVNGTEAKFTNDELKILRSAIIDLSNRMKQSVSFII